MSEETDTTFEWMDMKDVVNGIDPVLDGASVTLSGREQVTLVVDSARLQCVLKESRPGHIIELADGSYDVFGAIEIRNKSGTAEKPLIIRAQNRGKAVITGRSWLSIMESSYVVIEGLCFEGDTSDGGPRRAVELLNCNRCRVTRNEFALNQSSRFADNGMVHWVFLQGEKANENRIDHNRFTGKQQSGYYIGIEGEHAVDKPGTGTVPWRTRIDRNHFQDVERSNANGAETIKIGSGSRTVLTDARTIIEYNLFERCSGEDEIISVKSSGNIIRYNTFLESEGAVVLRYGNGSEVYGNFFIGRSKSRTGGVRIHGTDHRIYNNYFESLSANAVTIGWGNVDEDPTVAKVYWQVKRVEVVSNTFVNNLGTVIASIYSSPGRLFDPQDVRIANNVIQGESGLFVKEVTGELCSGLKWDGNIIFPKGSAIPGIVKPPHEIRIVDPLFVYNGVFFQLSAGSPAIGASTDECPYVWEDGVRTLCGAKQDAGFMEYKESSCDRGPLDSKRVGPHSDL